MEPFLGGSSSASHRLIKGYLTPGLSFILCQFVIKGLW